MTTSNTETKELKRRLRDIIEPGRDLGHVDDKKSVKSTTQEQGHQGSNENENPIKAQLQRKEINGEIDVSKSCAVGNIQVDSVESPRKYESTGADQVEARNEGREIEVEQRPDKSICEDCN